jgi:poly-beta-1,6-N-acetyl-D-glucosamine synthase
LTADRRSQLAALDALLATARGEQPPGDSKEPQAEHAQHRVARHHEPPSRKNGHRRPDRGPSGRDAGSGDPGADDYASYAPAMAFVATLGQRREEFRSAGSSTTFADDRAAEPAAPKSPDSRESEHLARRRWRGTKSVAVLIPAHNEEARISKAIVSLRKQARQPDRIIVVCDNCTDRTEDVAFMEGAEIIVTQRNKRRKAGALNQALYHVLPELRDHDFVLTMDADSSLNPQWIASAIEMLDLDPKVGAVCGAFLGEPGGGLVGQIQRNEYQRYARIIQRRRQALVLSGTGTIFRVGVLREIASERGRTLPGRHGQCYNPVSITEDDEITLAVKTLGWKCLSPAGCRTITEVMPTWRALWTQRMRWQVGTLSDLSSYGMSRVTWSYWARQAGLYGGFMLSFACLAVMILALVQAPGISEAWTAGCLTVTLAERTWTARRAGWRGVLLAVAILPEALYALFQGWLFFAAFCAHLQRREVRWGHL